MISQNLYSHIMWGKHPQYRTDGKWTAIQTGNLQDIEAAAERRKADGWTTLTLPLDQKPSEPWSVTNQD